MRTISYKVSYENMISRLPALFAFLEYDEQGACEIVKATRGEQGDYGKIIANVIIPEGHGFYYKCKDGETILQITEKTEKSYRTIINTYYKALSDKSWERDDDGIYEEKFLAFVEKGIGLKYVGLSEEVISKGDCGVKQTKKYPLAPDYIYLGEAKTLLEKMINLQNQVKFYEEHTKMCKDDLRFYQRCKDEFEARNGEKLITKLYELIDEAEDTANVYLGYTNDAKGLTLDFKVNLVNTIKDLGMVTPYIQQWEGGKRYYKGDVVYYVDDNGYGLTLECTLNGVGVQTDDFGRKYTEGEYNDETEEITFDSVNWKAQTLNWVKRNTRYICPKCGRFYEDEKPTACECGYEFTDNDKTHTYIEHKQEMPNTITVDGKVMSQLSSLRRFETYTNRNDEAEYPSKYEDWLWYYRVGRVMNREEKYDELGNLGVMYGEGDDDNFVVKGIEAIINEGENIDITGDKINYALNLAAWGDVITSITAENGEGGERGTLKIEYVLGAHLKAEYIGSATDDDGNYKYYFKNFTIDTDSNYGKNMGVKYTDTYIYYKDSQSFLVLECSVTYSETSGYHKGDTVTEEIYNKYQASCLKKEYYSVKEEFVDQYGDTYYEDTIIAKAVYEKLDNENKKKCEIKNSFIVNIDFNNTVTYEYEEGSYISRDVYDKLSDADKAKCWSPDESIWSMVEDGIFEAYINGKYDKDTTTDVEDDEHYYKLYNKMPFYYDTNAYKLKMGNSFKDVEYIESSFKTTVDIKHIDIEERPLIRYDYYNGVSFQPTIDDDVNIERGVTQAFEKHIKLGEIKTFEDFENYSNGGFFVISKENIDLG